KKSDQPKSHQEKCRPWASYSHAGAGTAFAYYSRIASSTPSGGEIPSLVGARPQRRRTTTSSGSTSAPRRSVVVLTVTQPIRLNLTGPAEGARPISLAAWRGAPSGVGGSLDPEGVFVPRRCNGHLAVTSVRGPGAASCDQGMSVAHCRGGAKPR